MTHPQSEIIELDLAQTWLYHYSFEQSLTLPISHRKVHQTPLVDVFEHEQRTIIVSRILEVLSWYYQGNHRCRARRIQSEYLFSEFCLTPDALVKCAYPFTEMVP